MERFRLPFAAQGRPDRSGAVVLDDVGRLFLQASPALAGAFHEAVGDPSTDLSPLHFDDHRRGLALAASLVKGLSVRLLECEFVAGAFEVRAYVGGSVRLTLQPGDFDPDAGWEFLLAVNDAKLEMARP